MPRSNRAATTATRAERPAWARAGYHVVSPNGGFFLWADEPMSTAELRSLTSGNSSVKVFGLPGSGGASSDSPRVPATSRVTSRVTNQATNQAKGDPTRTNPLLRLVLHPEAGRGPLPGPSPSPLDARPFPIPGFPPPGQRLRPDPAVVAREAKARAVEKVRRDNAARTVPSVIAGRRLRLTFDHIPKGSEVRARQLELLKRFDPPAARRYARADGEYVQAVAELRQALETDDQEAIASKREAVHQALLDRTNAMTGGSSRDDDTGPTPEQREQAIGYSAAFDALTAGNVMREKKQTLAKTIRDRTREWGEGLNKDARERRYRLPDPRRPLTFLDSAADAAKGLLLNPLNTAAISHLADMGADQIGDFVDPKSVTDQHSHVLAGYGKPEEVVRLGTDLFSLATLGTGKIAGAAARRLALFGLGTESAQAARFLTHPLVVGKKALSEAGKTRLPPFVAGPGRVLSEVPIKDWRARMFDLNGLTQGEFEAFERAVPKTGGASASDALRLAKSGQALGEEEVGALGRRAAADRDLLRKLKPSATDPRYAETLKRYQETLKTMEKATMKDEAAGRMRQTMNKLLKRGDLEGDGILRQAASAAPRPLPKQAVERLRTLGEEYAKLQGELRAMEAGASGATETARLGRLRNLNAMKEAEIRTALADAGRSVGAKTVRELGASLADVRKILKPFSFLKSSALLVVDSPTGAVRAMGHGLSSVSEEAFLKIQREMMADAHYLDAKAVGMEFSDPSGVLKGEIAPQGLVRKAPGGAVLKGMDQVKAANLNTLRLDAWKRFVRETPNATREEIETFVTYINRATGKGYSAPSGLLKDLGKAVDLEATVGKLALPESFVAKGAGGRTARRQLGKLLGVYGGIGGSAYAAGGRISFDPDAKDFLHVYLPGGASIDPLWEVKPLVRALAKEVRAVSRREGIPPGEAWKLVGGPVGEYLRSGLSPEAELALSKMEGLRGGAHGSPTRREGPMRVGDVVAGMVESPSPVRVARPGGRPGGRPGPRERSRGAGRRR